MLTYERLAETLGEAARNAGLEIVEIKNFIEMPALDRSYEMVCVPADWEPPYPVRARVDFGWDASFTAETVYGPDAVCSLYHQDDEECPHQRFEPNLFIDLGIKYELRPPEAEEAPQIAGVLRRILEEQIQHDNLPQIKFEISYLADRRLVIHDAFAYQFWELDDILHQEPDLDRIFGEVARVLNALKESGYFKPYEDEGQPRDR